MTSKISTIGSISKSKCPDCEYMQAHKVRGHKHVITCNNCGDRFVVEERKKIVECYACGRLYDDDLTMSRCPVCKTPFKRAKTHTGSKGRCKSIW